MFTLITSTAQFTLTRPEAANLINGSRVLSIHRKYERTIIALETVSTDDEGTTYKTQSDIIGPAMSHKSTDLETLREFGARI